MKKIKGFTLAEVLITLGVIGVIASMTIPALIQKHHNTAVENKLKKVYTTMNQAMRMSEIDNGDRKYWFDTLRTKSGIEHYILPYIKYTKIEEDAGSDANSFISIYFADGTILQANKHWTGEWDFYTMDVDKCKQFNHHYGVCRFKFSSYKEKYYFEGYFRTSEVSINILKNNAQSGCYTNGSYCSTLIEKNGWKIPDDYPYKVR